MADNNTVELSNDVRQDPTKDEAVAYLVFTAGGDQQVFEEFQQAENAALDVIGGILGPIDEWDIYPLYAGPGITIKGQP